MIAVIVIGGVIMIVILALLIRCHIKRRRRQRREENYETKKGQRRVPKKTYDLPSVKLPNVDLNVVAMIETASNENQSGSRSVSVNGSTDPLSKSNNDNNNKPTSSNSELLKGKEQSSYKGGTNLEVPSFSKDTGAGNKGHSSNYSISTNNNGNSSHSPLNGGSSNEMLKSSSFTLDKSRSRANTVALGNTNAGFSGNNLNNQSITNSRSPSSELLGLVRQNSNVTEDLLERKAILEAKRRARSSSNATPPILVSVLDKDDLNDNSNSNNNSNHMPLASAAIGNRQRAVSNPFTFNSAGVEREKSGLSHELPKSGTDINKNNSNSSISNGSRLPFNNNVVHKSLLNPNIGKSGTKPTLSIDPIGDLEAALSELNSAISNDISPLPK